MALQPGCVLFRSPLANFARALHRRLVPLVILLLGGTVVAAAEPYPAWRHSAPLVINTTPSGANLPDTAREENFPLLVRLHSDWFDFRQAHPAGNDLRFSDARNQPLDFEIEEWNPDAGRAHVWVRIPLIEGNQRQSLTMHWGEPNAPQASNGPAVFSPDRGYLAVFHLADPTRDSSGRLEPVDRGTTPTPGVIGPARRFANNKGIFCGDKLTGLPTGAQSHTTSAWLKPTASNSRVFGWGNEAPQGKVILNYRSPPHIRMECYFSGADVAGKSRVDRTGWIHVVHTYQQGESLLYVNGMLDGVTRTKDAPLRISTPARMWVGGWYEVYDNPGDVDEVRLANVLRSADWARLEFENQKPLSTLVGPLVTPGTALSVVPSTGEVDEGRELAFTLTAGGAEKITWSLVEGDRETVLATDQLKYTWQAGRTAGDRSATLRIRVTRATGPQALDVPLRVRERLPEPKITLTAPPAWNGRDLLTLRPTVANRAELEAAGVGDCTVTWQTAGLAVVREVEGDELRLRKGLKSGPLKITATVANGGAPVSQGVELQVTEPERDPWIEPTPAESELPVDRQFFARNDRNEGTLVLNGRVAEPVPELVLRLYADDKLVATQKQAPQANGDYRFRQALRAGLVRYRVELTAGAEPGAKLLHKAEDLLCGDAFVITGQSNAVSTDWSGDKSDATHPWVRSFGSLGGDARAGWGQAVRRDGGQWQVGYWGLELGRHLVETHGIPICLINGAVGGTRIDQHLPNPTHRTDPGTIYGRMLDRVQKARLTHGIRGVLWHQGEADQGADGPSGDYGCENYEPQFLELAAAWSTDFPNLRHCHLFQIWPNACSQGGNRFSDRLRDVQRRLPRQFSRVGVMSTLGIDPEGGCHYPAEGYAAIARLIAPLVDRDHYGKRVESAIDAPNLQRAWYASAARDEIWLEFGQPMTFSPETVSQFFVGGEAGQVQGGEAVGTRVRLRLAGPSQAQTLNYIHDRQWNRKQLLRGQNGIAALSFCEVTVEPPADEPGKPAR